MRIKSDPIDSMPHWIFRPASKFATWFLLLSALLVALSEVFYSSGTDVHLLSHPQENALIWGEILLGLSVLGVVGESLNRTVLAASGIFGIALWYMAFSLAALHDHTDKGRPEIILPIITVTLASMYMVVGTMKVFHVFMGYYKEQ